MRSHKKKKLLGESIEDFSFLHLKNAGVELISSVHCLNCNIAMNGNGNGNMET